MKVNGWTLVAHPLFVDQLTTLRDAVKAAREKDPEGYKNFSNTKLLAHIYDIIMKRIPADPGAKRFRQGVTLGNDYKNWFREKFGSGRFRLFFRYDSRSQIIAFAWVNDEKNLRTYGSTTDAYRVFQKMLDDGNPLTAGTS